VAYLLNAITEDVEKQPLLGNAARSNRGGVTIRDETRTIVVMEKLNKRVSTQMNTRNNRRVAFSLGSVPRCQRKVV
jgi:hypothetical protein